MVLTRSAAAKQEKDNETHWDTQLGPEAPPNLTNRPPRGPGQKKDPYNPNEEVELEANLQDIRDIQQRFVLQFGICMKDATGPQHYNGERVMAEVFRDLLQESVADTSLEETAYLLQAIATDEPGNWIPGIYSDTSLLSIKRRQVESPEIQVAIRALGLNERDSIRTTWEQTPPKQRTPMQQFLL